MSGATDVLTRWPALVVGARRARLRDTLRLFGDPISEPTGADVQAAERAAAGLWRRQPSAWSSAPGVREKIAGRLGWLDSPALMADSLERLTAFAAGVRRDGVTDVVLLGMGGSSLAPEVLRAVLGTAPGWPRFHMLDSTDPAAVRAATTTPAHTLYVLASKSGTTIEPNTLAAHFRRTLEQAGIPRWASHFIAITDDGTELAVRARTEAFRDVFINPSDIGGRYSALSFFGLVPAALMGHDTAALVGWGLAMISAAESGTDGALANPAIGLGLAIGAAAKTGRDKLSLLVPSTLAPFGLWVEQLVAESTGKQGVGVVPIAGEASAGPSAYGADRLFVQIRQQRSDGEDDARAGALRAAGHPFAAIDWLEPAALGAEFVRWEVATAIAGALLEINPFDEPNVQQAKDATNVLLASYRSHGELPRASADRTSETGVTLTLTNAARSRLGDQGPDALLTLIGPGDYFALLAYVGPEAELADELADFRHRVRTATRAATMFGYGPRYLHSTGQLHKGGPNTGVFVLISAAPRADLDIPGYPFSFGTLELAQALGDFTSLDATARRALHVHLPAPERRYVREVADALLQRVGST